MLQFFAVRAFLKDQIFLLYAELMEDSSLENESLKSKLTDASDRWMEARSLVLRQTIWAKSLIMLLSLGSIGVLGGIL